MSLHKDKTQFHLGKTLVLISNVFVGKYFVLLSYSCICKHKVSKGGRNVDTVGATSE